MARKKTTNRANDQCNAQRETNARVTWDGKYYDPMVWFSGLLVLATLTLAYIAWKTDRTLQAQQRAWVRPLPIEFRKGLKRGEEIDYIIPYTNVGKEPATKLVIQGEPRTFNTSQISPLWLPGENQWCKVTKPNSGGRVIWPNQVEPIFYKQNSLPEADAERIAKGKAILLLEGCIGYETVGENHFSAFCYYVASDGQLRSCMNHYFAN